MFEIEAGFAETKMLINCNGDYSKKQDYKKGWQDGAEFGYNKANEWHYVKGGDLPKDNRKVCLYTKDRECYMGFFENGAWKYESGFYVTDDFVIAWKEIVLPKESE